MKRILIITLVIISIIILYLTRYNNESVNDNTFPFKETIILKNRTPIVQFKLSNNEKVNMLLDTGSEITIIDNDIYDKDTIIYKTIKETNLNISGINGNDNINVKLVETCINDSILSIIYVFDIDDMIDRIFIKNGIIIDGVIGCDFLYKNHMIIDFENKVLKTDTIDK